MSLIKNSDELYNAIKTSDKEKVMYLLDNKIYNVNKIVGLTSYLHYAIQHSNTEIIKILLDHGAVVNRSIFPIFRAKNENIIKLLLNYDVDLDSKDFYGATYLFLAVQNKLIDIVNILIDKGANVNASTIKKLSVLELAFQGRNYDIIDRLLQCDIDIYAKNKCGETPLHHAVNAQNIKFIKLILKKGANINEPDKFGNTPLHMAVSKNDIKSIEYLIAEGADVNYKTLKKKVPLHIAVSNEFIDIAELLLKHGANVNDCTENGITPLHTAVKTNNKNMVMLLMKHGANVNAIGTKDESPLIIAIAYEYDSIAEYLISNGAIVNNNLKTDMLLHMAVFNMNEKLVELLLRNNVDISVKNNNGETALHKAVIIRHRTIVELILGKGGNVNDQTNIGDTPLHISTENKDIEISKILLRYNPNINVKNVLGETPLYNAAKLGHLKLVQMLLEHQPKISDNNLALYYAVKGKGIQCKEIILELLAYGFTMEFLLTCSYFQTYNFIVDSVINGHSGIVEYLIKYGIDPNIQSPFIVGYTNFTSLLHHAVKNNKMEIARLLIDYNSDVNAIDEIGLTPIYYAVETNNLEITSLLLNHKAVINTNYILFFTVISQGNLSIIKEFLNYYKDINIEDEFGTTALHFAAWNGDEETIQLLLDKGIKYKPVKNLTSIRFSDEVISNITNYYGQDVLEDFFKNMVTTPLHIAARKNHSDIVETLLEIGFDVNSRDGCGRTPLHIAALYDNIGIIRVLMEFNCDFCATDDNGYTCIDYACDSEHFMSNMYLDTVFLFIHNVDCVEHKSVRTTMSVKTLIKYLVMSTVISTSNKEKVLVKHSKLQKFYKKCNKDIEDMKKKVIFRRITFYDMLTKSIDTLASYLKNENFLQIYKFEIQKYEFYIYNDILNNRIARAREREVLLTEAEIYFSSVLCLPNHLSNKIMRYLYNRDLRCVQEAFKIFFDNSGYLKCKES